jgi:hypothetical protein
MPGDIEEAKGVHKGKLRIKLRKKGGKNSKVRRKDDDEFAPPKVPNALFHPTSR